MKKGIFTLLTALTIFALAITGCPTPSSSNPDTYTVKFSLNGGTGTAPEDATVVVGQAVTLPAKDAAWQGPSGKPDFIGWNSKATDTTALTSYTPTADNTTLYAIWAAAAAVQYTVTYDLNGGGGTVPAAETKASGTTITLPLQGSMTAPNGKPNFLGWNKDQNATTGQTGNYTFTETTTLYAIWGAGTPQPSTTYTVTFDKNNTDPGSTDANPTTKTVTPPATKIDALPAAPTRTGYTFAGWFTVAAATGGVEFINSTDVTVDVTVYARWTASAFTVTFNKNGGDTEANPATRTVTPPATTTTLPGTAPTKLGFTFAGWFTVAVATGGTEFKADTPVTENITVYARWTANTYADKTWVERVELVNGNVAAYYFELSGGKTWGDYQGIEADFFVTQATYDASNRVRGGPRLYGNYSLDYLAYNETTAGNKFWAASIGNGNGQLGNGNLIMDNGFLASDWGPIASGNEGKSLYDKMQAAFIPDDKLPVADDWWTLPYYTDGTKANGDYQKPVGGAAVPGLYKPADSDTGPFIFGLGLTGQTDPTVALVSDVRLVGKSGTPNLIGKPLYIKATAGGAINPAFVSYTGTAGNGVDENKREFIKGTIAEVNQAAASAGYTVTFNLNAGADSTAVFAPSSFSGSISAEKYFGIPKDDLPSATGAKRFVGWGDANDSTTPIPIADAGGSQRTIAYNVDKTLYGIWTDEAPPALDPDPDAPEGTPIAVTIVADDIINGGGKWDAADVTGGYSITSQATGDNNYGWVNPWFKLNFTTLGITDLTNIKAIEFDYTPLAGDSGYKNLMILANDAATGYLSDSDITAKKINVADVGNASSTQGTAKTIKLLLPQAKIGTLTDASFFCIRIHAKGVGGSSDVSTDPTSWSITNIKLIPFAP